MGIYSESQSEHVHADWAWRWCWVPIQLNCRGPAGSISHSFRDAEGNVPVYFEAAAVIVTLVLLGQVLELRARVKRRSIKALLGLAPETARRISGDGHEETFH